ncbi:hypothetical protein BX616_006735 [Lobosporangium transversale]|nr:hypothetical protein BX616_006735 [Lobosporangium transversale]
MNSTQHDHSSPIHLSALTSRESQQQQPQQQQTMQSLAKVTNANKIQPYSSNEKILDLDQQGNKQPDQLQQPQPQPHQLEPLQRSQQHEGSDPEKQTIEPSGKKLTLANLVDRVRVAQQQEQQQQQHQLPETQQGQPLHPSTITNDHPSHQPAPTHTSEPIHPLDHGKSFFFSLPFQMMKVNWDFKIDINMMEIRKGDYMQRPKWQRIKD